MKTFVMKGIGQVGFAEKPMPRPGPMDAIIRTTMALICTSDSHTVRGAIGPRENLTLGHEAVGVVHEVGPEVRGFKAGERIVVGAITPDWGDPASQGGHSSQSGQALGGWKFANIKDGVFAEYFHVNDADANLAHIPRKVPDEAAVYCADMLSTGLMAAENADIPIGGAVAVFALGPSKFGADATVDFSRQDAVAAVMQLTAGAGVDSSIEALGGDLTFQNAIKVTKPGGTISNAGYHGEGEFVHIPRLDWGVGMAEKTIRTGLCPGGRLRMERLLRLLEAGRVDPTPLTTHRFRFDEMPKAFETMDKKLDGIIKPLILFSS